ncbi:T9SS type A sorting domain-containing protein [Mangrovimonas cancribranchiae]|uniref:T9SS type A sorting domain-containing protein n=1 Tax=Mangrovimonas cancribranchiae TaxID=3080055 RepID=A0AAU6P555_9FLAO
MTKHYIYIVMMLFCSFSYGQITFNGCHYLFNDQDFTFVNTGSDATGRNIFVTTPVDGNQPCHGIGICEFEISWSETNNRWEFIADDGNGNFSSPFLIYYNTEASTPNPPSLQLGTWIENTVVTLGNCGGALTELNSTLIGDVQDETLNIGSNILSSIKVYPVPAKDMVSVTSPNHAISNVTLFNLQGKIVKQQVNKFENISLSGVKAGVYLMEINTKTKNRIIKKIIVQ